MGGLFVQRYYYTGIKYHKQYPHARGHDLETLKSTPSSKRTTEPEVDSQKSREKEGGKNRVYKKKKNIAKM